jgi:hypothetical protein
LPQLLRKPFVRWIFLYQVLLAVLVQLTDFLLLAQTEIRYDSGEAIGRFPLLCHLICCCPLKAANDIALNFVDYDGCAVNGVLGGLAGVEGSAMILGTFSMLKLPRPFFVSSI